VGKHQPELARPLVVTLFLLASVVSVAPGPPGKAAGEGRPAAEPIVIAHRGASGYIVPRDASGASLPPTTFVDDAHEAGLLVHPYTFRNENNFLPLELRSSTDPAAWGDARSEYEQFYELGVDGLFSDQPNTAVQARGGGDAGRGEPRLVARAILPSDAYQPGPPSGAAVAPNNGVTPPFPSQPIPGFSAVLKAGAGTYWGMPDNGYGAKGNSADFLLRLYRIRPNFTSALGGSGEVDVLGFVQLSDPYNKVGFPLTRPDRLLTGADFDLESVRRTPDGDLWFGEEFGPFILHTDSRGRVLEAPIRCPECSRRRIRPSPIRPPPTCRPAAASSRWPLARTGGACIRCSRVHWSAIPTRAGAC
jgi:Esterase-like activity of phytase/Glycerophosphoryl diester phosphodiesterase family